MRPGGRGSSSVEGRVRRGGAEAPIVANLEDAVVTLVSCRSIAQNRGMPNPNAPVVPDFAPSTLQAPPREWNHIRGVPCGGPRRSGALLLLASAALALLAFGAPSQPPESTIVTFDGGAAANIGAWTYGLAPTYPSTGGNPAWYLHTTGLDTFAPQLRTTASSVFTGDYNAGRVEHLGVDLKTIAVDFSAGGRPLALILLNNNGTLANTNDDWGAFVLGANIPVPGDGWKSFDYAIPYWVTSAAMPSGWTGIKFGGASPNPNWGTLIKKVDRVIFFYGNPEDFFIFQMWTVGADNIRQTRRLTDINSDGVVDGADLAIVLGNWDTGNAQADLNADGIVNGADLALVLGDWSN